MVELSEVFPRIRNLPYRDAPVSMRGVPTSLASSCFSFLVVRPIHGTPGEVPNGNPGRCNPGAVALDPATPEQSRKVGLQSVASLNAIEAVARSQVAL